MTSAGDHEAHSQTVSQLVNQTPPPATSGCGEEAKLEEAAQPSISRENSKEELMVSTVHENVVVLC